MRNSEAVSFSPLWDSLEREDQLLLSNVRQWRWAAACGEGPDMIRPVSHPRHQRWIARRRNVHSPAHREIMLMLHGDAVYGQGGKVFPRAPGSVFLFDHNESRDWVAAPWQKDFRSLWVHFPSRNHITCNTASRDAKGRHYREITSQPAPAGAIGASEIMDAWDVCKTHPGAPIYWEYLKALVSALLMQILAGVRPLPPETRHQQVIASILSYIDAHLSEDLSLSHLARMAGYSPFFFHRLFVDQTGKRPKEYVDQARLKRARQLLREGYTTAAIAEELGLATSASFSRFFKRHVSESPRQWRGLEG